MKKAFEPLRPAIPTFNDTGIARSDRYDDLYHSASGAVEQAQYVFLQGNGLPQRWQGKSQFTILETGFGLGNNFLTTWQAWRDDPQRSNRLHFVSFEAHPFQRDDLHTMLAHAPAAHRPLVDQLLAQWPVLLPGIHRLEFEQGAVTLTLCFGDIGITSRRMRCLADAFYLDGFAPRVNPEMWSRRLFGQLVRMAAKGATAATWCSATQVRKDLEAAGFIVERQEGFAFKRHMITAQLRPHLGHNQSSPLPTAPVVVIGGGIAGAATAHALALRGLPSVVVDPVFADDLGGAHAGHAAVAITPLITRDDAPRARLSRAGILRAWQRWRSFIGTGLHASGAFVVNANNESARYQAETLKQLAFPTEWVEDIAAQPDYPHGGVYFPYGLWAKPQLLLRQLLHQPLVRTVAQQAVAIERNGDTQRWQVTLNDGQQLISEQVVLANAAGAAALVAPFVSQAAAKQSLSMAVLGGQSNVISQAALPPLPVASVAGEGYAIRINETQCAVGSTYCPPDVGITAAAHHEIMGKIAQLMPLQQAEPVALTSWYGLRAALNDHLPVISQVQTGLWLNTGYGSYGFSWAALAADIISAEITTEPALIGNDLAQALSLR